MAASAMTREERVNAERAGQQDVLAEFGHKLCLLHMVGRQDAVDAPARNPRSRCINCWRTADMADVLCNPTPIEIATVASPRPA
jgi:hypothetical protein